MEPIKNLYQYCHQYQKSIEDPENFWEQIAEDFYWHQKWDRVLDWDFQTPQIKWFENAKLNITDNALDRHVEKHPDKIAIIWEPNNPQESVIKLSYKKLYDETCRFANGLETLGITKGDRVIIYMPMVVQAAIAMLACARIGAIHSVVFAGFSAHSLADRIDNCQAK
ncbi:MAG: AMP-binding protein, partial [Flavobacteriaceae bacterium]|nr:AMP-binding protein [Flavobacteriaceae bacterium]MCY4254030.1 AMP-binding protein [Flavobacteriaceae bacterium]